MIPWWEVKWVDYLCTELLVDFWISHDCWNIQGTSPLTPSSRLASWPLLANSARPWTSSKVPWLAVVLTQYGRLSTSLDLKWWEWRTHRVRAVVAQPDEVWLLDTRVASSPSSCCLQPSSSLSSFATCALTEKTKDMAWNLSEPWKITNLGASLGVFECFFQRRRYGIALAALGMLATLSCGLTIDGFGPISDNAGGIAATRWKSRDRGKAR